MIGWNRLRYQILLIIGCRLTMVTLRLKEHNNRKSKSRVTPEMEGRSLSSLEHPQNKMIVVRKKELGSMIDTLLTVNSCLATPSNFIHFQWPSPCIILSIHNSTIKCNQAQSSTIKYSGLYILHLILSIQWSQSPSNPHQSKKVNKCWLYVFINNRFSFPKS